MWYTRDNNANAKHYLYFVCQKQKKENGRKIQTE